MYRIFILFFVLSSPLFATPAELTWYGQSAFKILTPNKKVLLIDPWIENPYNPNGKKDLEALDKVDVILITHGHPDHVGEAVEIAKKTNAKLITTYDLAKVLVEQVGYPSELAPDNFQGNFGGKVELWEGEVIIHFIPAIHGSSCHIKSKNETVYGGEPGGFLIDMRSGPVIYHTGDTDLFIDMQWIPKIKKVDVMLVCIGDFYTMGPEKAASAVGLVAPAVAIPMHYGTTPLLTGTPPEFKNALRKKGLQTKVTVLETGVASRLFINRR